MKKESPLLFHKNYAKIGYGNLKNPFANIRISRKLSDLIDWDLAIDYTGINNSNEIPLQKFNDWNIASSQVFTVMETERLASRISLGNENRNFYYNAIDRPTPIESDSLDRNITRIDFDFAFFNGVEKDIELDYKAVLKNSITRISDLDKTELNSLLHLSATKTSHKNLSFSFDGGIDYNRIGDRGNVISFIDPDLIITGEKYGLELGINVIQSDGELNIFPDIELNYAIDKRKLQAFIGASQSYSRNNYRNSVEYNPFSIGIDSLASRINGDIYGGVKGDIGGIIYLAKGGYKILDNHPVFNVDFTDELRRIGTEVTNLNSFYLSGSLEYPVQDWVSLGANTTQNFFTGIDLEELWSIPTLEFSAFAKLLFWKNRIEFKPTLFIRDRVNALDASGNNTEMDDLIDFNIEVEFRPRKDIGLWLRGYNLFDKSYRRWFGYENFGIHFQGGIQVLF
jgi:hypothetical protein